VIIGFIDRCQVSLDAAIYSFTHDKIADAVIRAHARGVDVRVLIDNTQAGSPFSDDERMISEGVNLQVDRKSYAMHNKFMIGDKKAVCTGSFNWTMNAAMRNDENFVIVRLSYVVRDFQKEFSKLWKKASITGSN
jgi:cardiolipin hydrolase